MVEDGVLGKSDISAKIFPQNTLTVDMFGNVFYRAFEYKMVTHARVFALIPKVKISQNQLLFASNSLKYLSKVFEYGNMCTWQKIKNLNIRLPIKDNAIDVKFMENFIIKLQASKMQELKKYLEVIGLSNYALTETEEKILSKKVKFKEFLIGDILKMQNTKCIVQEQIKINSGKIPYVTAASNNNGVMTYIDCPNEWLDKGNCIMIGGKTLTFTYQENDFCSNDSHNIALYLKEKNHKKRETILYMMAALNKSLSKKYSWGYSISMNKIKEDTFYLPVKNNSPDYDYMENYIKALQKLIIADVVRYANAKIAAAQKIIEER